VTAAAFTRDTALARLAEEPVDVLVVGGGITGAGVALDAASRGLRTALVEAHDFASGTSSRSSKLVHGGLRYLQQRDVRLVYEGLAERQVLLHNAPHLVRVLPFLIPHTGSRAFGRAMGTALWLYDVTGGLRIGHRHRRVGRDEALALVPTLRADRLVAGFLYYDAWADDARLTLAVIRTAVLDHGAIAVNHLPVRGLLKDGGGRVVGARVGDGAEAMEVRARVVVNAGGVWSDEVRALDEGGPVRSLRPAKGVHVTIPWEKVRNQSAAVLPVAGDRRSIFLVPWGDRAYLGTTDTDYDGPLDDPACTPDDVAYLLDAANAALTQPLTVADVLGTWAGLRPLVRDAGTRRTADLSRRHRVLRSPSGVVSVVGGKLTTYRRMAADTVDAVVADLGGGHRSQTRRLPLRGADGTASPGGEASSSPSPLDVPPDVLAHLVSRYGSEAPAVAALAAADPTLAQPLVPTLPYLRAEAVHAVRHEMARTLDDVLSRRTRARLLARDRTAAAAPDVAHLLASELGWSPARADEEAGAYRSTLVAERERAGLPPSS
jgi:glycerol-3-phosphate dehydrogenase